MLELMLLLKLLFELFGLVLLDLRIRVHGVFANFNADIGMVGGGGSGRMDFITTFGGRADERFRFFITFSYFFFSCYHV